MKEKMKHPPHPIPKLQPLDIGTSWELCWVLVSLLVKHCPQEGLTAWSKHDFSSALMYYSLGRERKGREWNKVSQNRFMHLKLQILKSQSNPYRRQNGRF
jgi:hypothetical protein